MSRYSTVARGWAGVTRTVTLVAELATFAVYSVSSPNNGGESTASPESGTLTRSAASCASFDAGVSFVTSAASRENASASLPAVSSMGVAPSPAGFA